MTLQNEISALKERLGQQVPPAVLLKITDIIEELRQADIIANHLKKGDKAPDFTLPNVRGSETSSTEVLAAGPMVLSFYRGGW